MLNQVSNTLATAVVACLLKDLSDCNPDVGMGPSDMTIIQKALNRLRLTEADVDMRVVLNSIQQR